MADRCQYRAMVIICSAVFSVQFCVPVHCILIWASPVRTWVRTPTILHIFVIFLSPFITSSFHINSDILFTSCPTIPRYKVGVNKMRLRALRMRLAEDVAGCVLSGSFQCCYRTVVLACACHLKCGCHSSSWAHAPSPVLSGPPYHATFQ